MGMVCPWLTVVECLESGELVLVLLHEVSELVHQAASVTAGHSAPWAIVEGFTRGLDGFVHIFDSSFLDGCDLLLSGGVEGVEGLSGGGVHELAVDEQLSDAGFDL